MEKCETIELTPFDFIWDGERLPITTMFDIDRQETNDPDAAVFVVGPKPNGKWFAAQCFPGDIVKRRLQ